MNPDIYKNIQELACKEANSYKKIYNIDDFKKTFTEGNVIYYNCIDNNNIQIDKIKYNNHPGIIYRDEIVFKHLKKLNITNFNFSIGLDDNYLHNWNIFTFSKNKYIKNILIPDLYALNNYSGKLNIIDMNKNKINKIVFAGTDTGNSVDLKLNQRLDFCSTFANHMLIDAKVTHIAQLSKERIASVYPNVDQFLSNPISIDDQLRYKFILSIDGNSTAWDRVPWIMNSNSLLLKYKSDNVNWYYPLINDREHYVECDKFDIEKKFIYYVNNLRELNFIISNANHFVKQYLNYDSQMFYFKSVIEKCKENNKLE